ncbi:MAG: hypothetical protein II938_04720 [Alphaproteobacteria bacterium]|nr:hypothetical protein [Alphaproteobacteria bacterium]
MKNLKNESGRSMLEMLGVLIVIALLILGSLTGYNYLIQRHRTLETTKEVSQLVMGVKTGDLARKFSQPQKAVQIDPTLVIRGPQVNDGIMELSDVDGFITVSALDGGSFTAAMQVQPGTCQTVFEALKNDDLTVFSAAEHFPAAAKGPDGKRTRALTQEEFKRYVEAWIGDLSRDDVPAEVNKYFDAQAKGEEPDVKVSSRVGVRSTATGKAQEQVLAVLKECEMLGVARWEFNCPQGFIPYNYDTQFSCVYCPIDDSRYIWDGKKCCLKTAACGSVCEPCPNEGVCANRGSENARCVECNSNSNPDPNCKARWNKFAKHICLNESCIECLTVANCQNDTKTGYSDSDKYTGRTFRACLNHKCIVCNADYTATPEEGEYPCPQNTPKCNKSADNGRGECTACPTGQVWNATTRKCECGSGTVMDENGNCVKCYDSVADRYTDKGCEEEAAQEPSKPICWDPANPNDGSGNVGKKCVECTADIHCEGKGEGYFCNSNNACEKCPDGTYRRDGRCYACLDDGEHEEEDPGCPVGADTTKRLCKPEQSNDNGTAFGGSSCVLCHNNNYGDKEDEKDDGCDASGNKLCNAAEGTYGTECKYCKNTNNDDKKDAGCPDGEPLCEAASNAYGATCHTCQNTQPGDGKDLGCGDDKGGNLCNGAENGGYGTQCYKCINDKANDSEPDIGCNDPTKPMCNGAENGGYGTDCGSCPAGQVLLSNGTCGLCSDTKSKLDIDAGCENAAQENPSKPVCWNTAKKNDGEGTPGTECVRCVDTATGSNADFACDKATTNEEKPLCLPNGTVFGSTKTTVNDGKVNEVGNHCGVCLDDKTGTSTDTGCGGNGIWKGKKFCVRGACPNGNCARNGVNGAPSTWHNHASYEEGTQCVECIFNSDCPSGKYCVQKGTQAFTCQVCDGCVKADGTCMPKAEYESYDDLTRDDHHVCQCIGVVKTQTINDISGFDYNGKKRDIENDCKRLQTYRQREYVIPAHFYCKRYMHVSRSMEADDFVKSSAPRGIGKDSPAVKDKTWVKAHTNTIEPKYSTDAIPAGWHGNLNMVVQDRWAGEVGLSTGGFFYFAENQMTSKAKQEAAEKAAVRKLTVTARWAKGSSKAAPFGGYVCKKGHKNGYCNKKCSNFTGPY